MSHPDPALEWFREIVEPTVAEFLVSPGDKRRGCLAALAVASMTEHYFSSRMALGKDKKGLGRFKAEVRDYKNGAGNFSVGFVADIANAVKHVERKNGVGHEDLKPQRINTCGVMRCGWPLTPNPQILVGENLEWRLVDLIKTATDFWREKLGLSGHLSQPR
ncbi:MAG: hypothetical protein ABF812_13960 [Gluconobacter cerinus]|uniref:hypothetical protein n=1 Tax=Gluconobacter TaxID=441 RepID=UPI0039E7A267